MTDKAGQDFWQGGSLKGSQRRLIDNLGSTQQMYVRVDESWDDRPSTKIDDASPRSGKTADFRAGTDRVDSFPRKSNRLSRRLVCVPGEDLCADEYEVGLTRYRRW